MGHGDIEHGSIEPGKYKGREYGTRGYEGRGIEDGKNIAKSMKNEGKGITESLRKFTVFAFPVFHNTRGL